MCSLKRTFSINAQMPVDQRHHFGARLVGGVLAQIAVPRHLLLLLLLTIRKHLCTLLHSFDPRASCTKQNSVVFVRVVVQSCFASIPNVCKQDLIFFFGANSVA